MMKKTVYAQLHLHTAESSRCGVSTGAEMAYACKNAGYSVLVVTDHFFNANIRLDDRTMPWPKQVAVLMEGYKQAKIVGDAIGLTVLFGWETFNNGPEILTYGLGEEFLLDNPDIGTLSQEDYVTRVKAAGAFICHAHPYRQAFYIPFFTPKAELFDAIEVHNAAHVGDHAIWNDMALSLARQTKRIELAGSDAHKTDRVHLGAVCLPGEVHNNRELLEALYSRQCTVCENILPST